MALESESYALQRGDKAPGFELPGTDDETYSLEDFRDYGALLVVFTCNHCPYAKAKVDALNGIAEAYDEVAVVGINPNDADAYPEDSFERMRELVEDGTVRYDAYLRDETQEVAAAYGAMCTPDPFLFANEGAEGTDGAGGAESTGGDRDAGETASTAFRLAYHGRLDDALNPDDDPSNEPGFEMRQAIEAVLAGEDVSVPDRPSRGCSVKWRSGNEPPYWS